jgi:hypothetical protein
MYYTPRAEEYVWVSHFTLQFIRNIRFENIFKFLKIYIDFLENTHYYIFYSIPIELIGIKTC